MGVETVKLLHIRIQDIIEVEGNKEKRMMIMVAVNSFLVLIKETEIKIYQNLLFKKTQMNTINLLLVLLKIKMKFKN